MSIAKNTPTRIYYANTSSDDNFLSLLTYFANMVDPPKVISISYVQSEAALSTKFLHLFNTEALKLAAQGVTVVSSSGDDGANCYAIFGSKTVCGYIPLWSL
jgi:subtilase family serine protease